MKMSYKETVSWLFGQLPVFQRQGSAAYKPGLDTTWALAEAFGNPQEKFKSIHIAGTNGKGSCSHMSAAACMKKGLKTGLYTSPHLKDFRERIKIDGQCVSEDFVIYFVTRFREMNLAVQPSFFELTVIMAFEYFAQQNVDIAVIEVGMGGRLDSTNIIKPLACLITNISWDHKQFLGDTLVKIAGEKAGIIKYNTPVVISETQQEVRQVFIDKAAENQAPILFADAYLHDFEAEVDLKGNYQSKNIKGATALLLQLPEKYGFTPEFLKIAFTDTAQITGLMGRWQVLQKQPLIIADTAHNVAGLTYVFEQLNLLPANHLHIVWGTLADKDLSEIEALMPKYATYYFCAPNIPRALPLPDLKEWAQSIGFQGKGYPSVAKALEAAKAKAQSEDVIFIGGSTFVVAEIV